MIYLNCDPESMPAKYLEVVSAKSCAASKKLNRWLQDQQIPMIITGSNRTRGQMVQLEAKIFGTPLAVIREDGQQTICSTGKPDFVYNSIRRFFPDLIELEELLKKPEQEEDE